ncbi:MAG: hypothetical protein WA108_05885 [Thiobacillus sp.]
MVSAADGGRDLVVPGSQMLEFPLASFVTFCSNHGLLRVVDRPQWRTVKGGGREYVNKLAAGGRWISSCR